MAAVPVGEANLACAAAVDDASPTGPRQRSKAGLCTETRGPATSSKRKGQTQSTDGMAYGGKATKKEKRADVAKQAQDVLYPLTGEVQVHEVTGGAGWRLVVKKISQREATRKVAKHKGKKHTSAGYGMGPWETEREALAASTTFRNWVEFGQARHPRPSQNANRKRSHGDGAAAAADAERKERRIMRAKKLKAATKLDENMERQRGYALKREEWIQQLHDAIMLDAVHTLIRPRSQKDEDPIDLTVELTDIDLSKVQKNRVLAIAQALKYYYTLLNEKFSNAAREGVEDPEGAPQRARFRRRVHSQHGGVRPQCNFISNSSARLPPQCLPRARIAHTAAPGRPGRHHVGKWGQKRPILHRSGITQPDGQTSL